MGVGPILQDHIGNGAPVLVLAACLKRDFLPVDQHTSSEAACFARLPKARPFLQAVDGVEPDPLGVAVVQDFDGVAVEDGDDGPDIVFFERGMGEKDVQHSDPDDRLAPHASGLVTPWRVECSRMVSRTAASETRRIVYLAPPPIPS